MYLQLLYLSIPWLNYAIHSPPYYLNFICDLIVMLHQIRLHQFVIMRTTVALDHILWLGSWARMLSTSTFLLLLLYRPEFLPYPLSSYPFCCYDKYFLSQTIWMIYIILLLIFIVIAPQVIPKINIHTNHPYWQFSWVLFLFQSVMRILRHHVKYDKRIYQLTTSFVTHWQQQINL